MAAGPPELASRRLLSPKWESARSKTQTVAPGISSSTKRSGKLACFDQRGESDLGVRLSGGGGPCAGYGNSSCLVDWRGRTLETISEAVDLGRHDGSEWP